MPGIGRISLLIDSPLRTVNMLFRGMDSDVRRQVSRYVKADSRPIWFEEVKGRAGTRIQQRVLAGTAKVGISGLSVALTSGVAGKMTRAAEFGANPATHYRTTSRKGNSYTRRHGSTFGGFTQAGKVVYPAVRAAIPRVAALVVQTVVRTVHETVEKAGS